MSAVYLCGTGLVCCLGKGVAPSLSGLAGRGGQPSMLDVPEGEKRPYYLRPIGDAPGPLVPDAGGWRAKVVGSLQSVWQESGACSADAALDPAVFVASSFEMEGIHLIENPAAQPGDFVRQLVADLGWSREPVFVNTACTSAYSAWQMALNLIENGQERDAVVLGVEPFNQFTMFGFESMQLLAPARAEPLGLGRQGLVLGEATAALRLTSRPNTLDAPSQQRAWRVMACANVVDGANPTGASEGALLRACQQALQQANLGPADIDLIKLQAAGSPSNDAIEMAALRKVFGELPPCVSLKMSLGHTLGASGAAETALLLACIEHSVWPSIGYTVEPAFEALLVSAQQPIDGANLRTVLLIGIGFGGGHSVVILKRGAP